MYRITSADIPGTMAELLDIANNMLDDGEVELKKYVPEDTGTSINDIKVQQAVASGFVASGKIFLDPNSDAIEYAEYWLNGVPSSQPRNYYKNGGRRNGGNPFLTSREGTKADFRTKQYLENNISKYI